MLRASHEEGPRYTCELSFLSDLHVIFKLRDRFKILLK